MRLGALSHIGQRRKLNEDSFFTSQGEEYLYGFVADGMGGHQAGEIASNMACEIIEGHIKLEFNSNMDYVEAGQIVRNAFIDANNKIYNYAEANSKMMGMGTTSTFAMVYQNKIITAHVGDSRVYCIGDDIKQVTKDHSYVQELLSRGEITEEMARNHPKKNYITRAMGTEETIKVDITIVDYNNEVVLICSDGLINMVSDDEIKNIVRKTNNLQQATQQLVGLANDNGGVDNITVVALAQG